MHIAILGNDDYQKEWNVPGSEEHRINWVKSLDELVKKPADAYIDLLFDHSAKRIKELSTLQGIILVNSVKQMQDGMPVNFARFNGWKTFISRPAWEVTCHASQQLVVQDILNVLGKKAEWVPDQAGLVSPRIISMIINEAYHALGDNVSSKQDIDTAMKLGTGYPYGPFEWSELIGLHHIYDLLVSLQGINEKYSPAPAMVKEIEA